MDREYALFYADFWLSWAIFSAGSDDARARTAAVEEYLKSYDAWLGKALA